MSMLYAFSVPLITFAFCFVVFANYQARTKKKELGDISVNPVGMVMTHVGCILAIEKQSKTIPKFPEEFLIHIKKPSSIFTTVMLKNMLMTKDRRRRHDICRLMTIISALYSTYIPLKLLLLDSRTKDLFLSIQRELAITTVEMITEYDPNKYPIDYAVRDPVSSIISFEATMKMVGATAVKCSREGVFPSLINFVIKNNNEVLPYPMSTACIQSMVTAYAALNEIKIPKSYIHYDWVTVGLMSPITDSGKKKLRLVK